MALQQDGQDFALYPKQSRQGFKPPAAHLWPKYWSSSPPNGHKASTSSHGSLISFIANFSLPARPDFFSVYVLMTALCILFISPL